MGYMTDWYQSEGFSSRASVYAQSRRFATLEPVDVLKCRIGNESQKRPFGSYEETCQKGRLGRKEVLIYGL